MLDINFNTVKDVRKFLCLLLTIALASSACQTPKKHSDQKIAESQPQTTTFTEVKANDIPVVDFEGLKPYLHRDSDTTYVVNFWATWCKPCVAELPYFEALHEDSKGKKIKVILVSLDFKKKIETNLVPFINKNKIASEVVVLSDADANTWINQVSPQWTGSIPATLVYNKQRWDFYEQSFDSFDLLKSILK